MRIELDEGIYLRIFHRLPRFLRRRIHPLEFALQEIARNLGARPGRLRVLDAGAGEARFQAFFQRHDYIPLDSTVGDSRWDYSRIHVCGDLRALPFVDESMDLVINFQVLEHVDDPAAAIREMWRVLRPGGTLCLTVPQGWPEHQQPHDYFRFTRFGLEKLLLAAGFQSFSILPMGGYFHYLGHRLSYIPKILFQQRTGLKRLLLSPLEVASLGLFCFVGPLVCYYLDGLDRKREFTLGYLCQAVKTERKR